MIKLRDYQESACLEVSKKLASGSKKIIYQLSTGGGKTVLFSSITSRYISKSQKKVLILVHRDELMNQSANTLFRHFDIISQKIDRSTKHSSLNVNIYVGMVETVFNRMKKNNNFFTNLGLVIIDECHIGNFRKIHEFFPDQYIIGFSATPLSAKKKFPLNLEYQDIVTGPPIAQLISEGSLCQNVTYNLTSVKRSDMKMQGGEFTDASQIKAFKTPKQLMNTIEGYKRFSFDKKTIVFNVNCEHSEAVNAAFLSEGFNSRHLDAGAGYEYRKETLEWFAKTDNAILNNIGIATTGFDEPSIWTVIVNRATASLPFWLQITGRGSRPLPEIGKMQFTILDLGGNAKVHGDWSDDIDWKDMFFNPPKASKNAGVAPVKECPECTAILHARATECKFCGYKFEVSMEFDSKIAEFEIVSKNKPLKIDVKKVIEEALLKKEYFALHQIKNYIVSYAKHQWQLSEIDGEIADRLIEMYHEKSKEWCREKGKRFNQWHKDTTKQWLLESLEKTFKYIHNA